MATPQLESKGVWGFNPEQDFSEGTALPKLFQFRIATARYVPRAMKRDGAKHFFFAVLRGEDIVTEQTHDVAYRAGWLPRVFDDRLTGSVPTNDGPDVDDADREPTAPISFFMALGDGTKSIPKDVDALEEYGGRFGMGTPPGKQEPWNAFCSALAQCGYTFDSPNLASLEGLILTLESKKIGTYTDGEGKERDLNIHLPIDLEVAKKEKGKTAKTGTTKTETKKSKPAPAPVDEDEEEEPEETPKPKTTGKKKSAPEPEEDEEEEEPEEDDDSGEEDEDDNQSPADVLHGVIVRMLSKIPNKTLPEGEIMLSVRKDKAFRDMDVKSQKAAINAYNSREIFENSDVLHYNEDADTVKYKPAKK